MAWCDPLGYIFGLHTSGVFAEYFGGWLMTIAVAYYEPAPISQGPVISFTRV